MMHIYNCILYTRVLILQSDSGNVQ